MTAQSNPPSSSQPTGRPRRRWMAVSAVVLAAALTGAAATSAIGQYGPPWGGGWATASCVGMPKPAKGDKLGDVRVRGAAPILVIGTTNDPATPYVGAEALAARIEGSGLLTFESTEHTAFARGISTCIDDTVVAYLVDGTLPPPGTRCPPN